jgi:hypothetical protein
MLSQYSTSQIYKTLNSTIFTSASFDILINEGTVLLRIHYKDNPEMMFSVHTRSLKQLDIRSIPGGVFKLGIHTVSYQNDDQVLPIILSAIPGWVTAIERELVARSVLQASSVKWNLELNEVLEKHYPNANEFFKQNEAFELRKTLDEMETSFSTRQDATEAEIAELKKAVNELKESMGKLPKKTWARSAVFLLGNIGFRFATSKEGMDLITHGVTKLVS